MAILAMHSLLGQQCSLTLLNNDEIEINDFDTISLRFYVSEADDVDLAQFQSVCGVRLIFEHQQLSDLTMVLTSPLGNDVTIIGPALENRTGFSPFPIDHDLIFLPNADPDVDPDPLLNEQWTNDLFNLWTQRSSWGGTYYPSLGDFGVDHDVGPVTGIWELTIIDHFLNGQGKLTGFEITFCEEDGLVCQTCESTAGQFTVQDTQSICRNEVLDLNNLFQQGPSDPSLYDDSFFIFDENGNAVQQGATSDFTVLPEGVYSAYALNMLSTQADTELTGLGTLTRDELLDSVAFIGGTLCMNISEPIFISITDPVLIVLPTENLCFGDSVVFGDQTIITSGSFLDTIGVCDTIFTLNVVSTDLQASFTNTSIFTNCQTGMVTFGPEVSGGVGPVVYEWRESGSAQIFTDSALTFSAASTWELLVRDNVCELSLDLTIEESGVGFTVDLEANPPSFNCRDQQSQIRYIPSFPVDSVLWFKDGVFLSRGDPFIEVDDESVYSIEVYGGNGCILTESLSLTSDFTMPSAQVNVPSITCSNLGVLATYSSTSAISQSIWINDQADTIGRSSEVAISTPGDYELLLIGDNFCVVTIPFEVTSDADLPVIDDVPTGDFVLNCSESFLEINPSIDPSAVDSYWLIGVDDTLRGTSELTISEANLYRLLVLGANGCLSERRLEVSIDTIKPTFSVIPDSLTCDRSQATIILRGISAIESASFSGDHIVSRTDTSVTVDDIGEVMITVVNTENLCMEEVTYDVRQDGDIPTITLGGSRVISCARPEVDLSSTFDGTPIDFFYWINPFNDTLREQSIVVRDTGVYRFEAFGINGCPFSESVLVTESLDVPILDLPPSYTTTCINDLLDISIGDTTMIDSVFWILGDDTISGVDLNIFTRERSVEVIVIGDNGCSTGRVIDILYDTLAPIFNLESDVIDCNNEQVEITTDIELSNHTFIWAGDGVANESGPSVMVTEPGAYALSVMDNETGCIGLMTIDVMSDFSEPDFTAITPDTLTCNRTSVNVSISTEIDNRVIWTTSDGRIVEEPTILATLSGAQLFEVIGTNGCSTNGDIEVFSNLNEPDVDIETNYELSCVIDNIVLNPDYIDPVSSVRWSFSDGRSSTGLTEVITDDKLESLTVTGLNGCEEVINFDITIANDIPQAEITNEDTLVCSGESIDLSSTILVSNSHRPIWFRDDVFITMDETTISASSSGDYVLQVVDTLSGCESSDTVEILINPLPLEQLELVIMDESCVGAMDGFINVTNLRGGDTDAIISLEGEIIRLNDENSVEPGSYTLMAEDDFGCMIDTLAVVEPGGFIDVELGGSLRVERGEKVTISPQYLGDPVSSVVWSSTQNLTSSEVDSLCFTPLVDQTLYITVTNDSGCEAVDSMLITVFVDVSKIKAYIPNILSKSNDRGNNEIRLGLPPDVIELTDFSIYDRWGQRVMYLPVVRGGDDVFIWDGRFNNTPVDNGVYVFAYEMLTIYDNRVRTRKGDITVID